MNASPGRLKYTLSGVIRIDGARVLFDTACSKGTYIRTLCADIGEYLGSGAHMSFLIRLKSGMFDISDALTLEEVDLLYKSGELEKNILPVDIVFKDYKRIDLNPPEEKRFLNGLAVPFFCKTCEAGEEVRVYGSGNVFLALGEAVSKDSGLFLKSKKVFC